MVTKQTNCEHLDCIGQLEIGQAGNLLKHHVFVFEDPLD